MEGNEFTLAFRLSPSHVLLILELEFCSGIQSTSPALRGSREIRRRASISSSTRQVNDVGATRYTHIFIYTLFKTRVIWTLRSVTSHYAYQTSRGAFALLQFSCCFFFFLSFVCLYSCFFESFRHKLSRTLPAAVISEFRSLIRASTAASLVFYIATNFFNTFKKNSYNENSPYCRFFFFFSLVFFLKCHFP